MQRYTSFAEFWPFYLREHSRALTRAWHYVGTSLVVLLALAVLLTGNFLLFAMMPVAGYFFAWVAHFGVEKNRPATFKYPLWSLGADWKMWWLWLTRRLKPELERAGSGAGRVAADRDGAPGPGPVRPGRDGRRPGGTPRGAAGRPG